MTGNTFIMYWQSNKDWYYLDENTGNFFLCAEAPRKAQDSFKAWIDWGNKKGIWGQNFPYKDFIASYEASK